MKIQPGLDDHSPLRIPGPHGAPNRFKVNTFDVLKDFWVFQITSVLTKPLLSKGLFSLNPEYLAGPEVTQSKLLRIFTNPK
jgi:hypothetical protein